MCHMRGGERAADGSVPQVLARDVLHHQVTELLAVVVVVRSGVQQHHQGMVAHPGEDAGFLPLQPDGAGALRVGAEEFDGNLAAQLLVVAPVDGGLASPADQGLNPVAPAKQGSGFDGDGQRV